ncbi:unnamed protein product, partial [Discosporangium mesarthrocarpum]
MLEKDCNFVVYQAGSTDATASKVWETESFYEQGMCFAMLQDNGMLVVVAGNDPANAGNILWSSNKVSEVWQDGGWGQRGNLFHASLQPDGNLIISRGASPVDPASLCVWGAFGCPGEGRHKFYKVWRPVKSTTSRLRCMIFGCEETYAEPEFDLGDRGEVLLMSMW